MRFPLHKDTALTPDGRMVTFTCQAQERPHNWFWHVRITGRNAAVGMTIAHASYVDETFKSHGLVVAEEVRYRGRSLVMAPTEDGTGWAAGWRGAKHSALFGGAGKMPDLADTIALLDLLDIEERHSGVVLRPLAGSGVTLWSLRGTRYVPAAGMVSVFPREDAPGLIPSGAGKQVSGGQVWSTSLGGELSGGDLNGRKFVHVGATGVSAIDDDRGKVPFITDEALETLISSLSVEWAG